MELIFLDEQYARYQGQPFTAISACSIEAERIDQFRSDYFSQVRQLLSTSDEIAGSVFAPVPILHGRELLPDYDDEIKLSALRALLSSFRNADGKIRRLGYFDESWEGGVLPPHQRVGQAISNLGLALGNGFDKDFAIIHEMDREGIRNGFLTLDHTIGTYYQVANSHGDNAITIPFRRMVGHYFGMKYDVGCQVADIANWISLKALDPTTDFSRKIADLRSEFGDLFIFEQIIYWNDRTRSVDLT